MRKRVLLGICAALAVFCLVSGKKTGLNAQEDSPSVPHARDGVEASTDGMIAEGRHIFRFDTFGDEAFWGDTLQLHQAIAGAKLGGIGPGVSPKTALAVGLKVDVDALPRNLIEDIEKGRVNLNDPAVTLALLRLNAVVGVTGSFN